MVDLIDPNSRRRSHECVGNVTQAEVYDGRRAEILKRREVQEQETIYQRFRYNLGPSLCETGSKFSLH